MSLGRKSTYRKLAMCRHVWGAATVALILVVTQAPPARAANSPVWRVVVSANPTNIIPDSPRNEVQELTIDATGGTFRISAASDLCEAHAFTEALPSNATAAEVQSALEALSCVIQGSNVTVSGGPGGSSPYVITFVGSLGNDPVPLLSVDSSGLTGGSASGVVHESAKGAFAPGS